MNAENFKEFIENPSRLYQLSYQELKSLVLQYPYSANLHYLLLQKSAMESHRELTQNRQRAAAYSLDRTHLYHLIQQLTAAESREPILQLDLEDEFLELKDLSLLEMTPPTTGEQTSADGSVAFDLPDRQPPEINPKNDDELDLLFDQLTIEQTENGSEISPGDDATPPPAENPLELIEPALPPIRPEVTEPKPNPATAPAAPPIEVAPFRIPNGLMRSAAVIATLPRHLTPPVEPVHDPTPAIAPAAPPQKTPDIRSTFREKQALLLHKLDDLIAEKAAAKTPGPVPSAPASVPDKKPAPQPKKKFTSWVQQFQPDHVKQQLSDLMEVQKREELKKLPKAPKRKKKKKSKNKKEWHIIAFAEQSLTEDQEIISETLAELLAEQGEIGKSINMYERLKLVFPEKSAYFAAIIEKLKKE